jgi:hypothetical protein
VSIVVAANETTTTAAKIVPMLIGTRRCEANPATPSTK